MFNIKKIIPSAVKISLKKIIGINTASIPDSNQNYIYPDRWLSSRKFYGQYGEDIKLWPLFRNQQSGYFVEVGAMEGVRFSNTYLYELRGWKGICVEPHPDYIDLLKKNRPHSIVLQTAVGKEDKASADFYTNYRGSMSTLDKSLEGFFRSHYGNFFGGFKTIKVPLKTLNSILRENNAPPSIDILSIDVEGVEVDVFKGLDFKKYSPRVIIAEISVRKEPVIDFMKNHGYIFVCENPSNAIFVRNENDAEIIRNANVVGIQYSPKHPLD